MIEGRALDAERRSASERSFVRLLAFLAAALALLPTLINWLTAPPGARYLGVQYNLDDHMVYAAWMRQAMEGRFFFDNRFATDPQPSLTIHLYFLALGWAARLVGIPIAMAAARAALSAAFVLILYRLVRRVCPDVYTTKLAMALAAFGCGGLGFVPAIWHTFGQSAERPMPGPLRALLLGRLPTDVWQPEGYGFPSMLTNGLFVASLCLIVVAFLSFLAARDGWRYVPHGALSMLLLMNVHSYDVLLVTLVMAAFLVVSLAQRQATAAWIGRSLVIGAGALPPALWFLHVYRSDPVFQARAATLTYSPNFRQVLFGYLFLIGLGLIALARGDSQPKPSPNRLGGVTLFVAGLAVLFLAASQHQGEYFLGLASWSVAMLVATVCLTLLGTRNPAFNLAACWALIGLVAPYFPALFQRKLSMGLAIPWAMLAALAVGGLTSRLERSARNLALTLAIVLLSASSVTWLAREVQLARLNISNTTFHPVYLGADASRIIRALDQRPPGHAVLLAMPGVRVPAADEAGNTIPDSFLLYLPDLNPILSGLTGVYTLAGHWSETPDYARRRDAATLFFQRGTPDSARRALLEDSKVNFIVAPVPQAFPALQLEDVSRLGSVVYEGPQFRLIRVR